MRASFPQILITLLMLPSFDAYGIPLHSPDSFFQEGYVNGTGQQRSSIDSITPDNATPHLPNDGTSINVEDGLKLPKSTPQDGFIGIDAEESFDSKEDQISAIDKEEKEQTIPIHSLALLLNASEVKETFSLIENMSTILKKFDIQPEAIYTMQIPQFFVRDASYDWANIIIRGGVIAMNRGIVDQYNIKKVPTWIARTAEGDVVLEGYDDISSFLNSKGELRRKQLERLRENQEITPEQPAIIPAGTPSSISEETASAIRSATTFSKEEILKKLSTLQENSAAVDIFPKLQKKEAIYAK